MIKNYLIISFRNLMKNKSYTTINVIGLVIGMTCCFIIALIIAGHVNYDAFHDNADRIYRVNLHGKMNNEEINTALSPIAMGPYLEKDLPEIEAAIRFRELAGEHKEKVRYKDNQIFENAIFSADARIFDVFSFNLLNGDPKTALNRRNSVVINQDIAAKLFKEEDPIGKIIKCKGFNNLVVTGIMENVPQKSHFQPRMFISMETFLYDDPAYFENWMNITAYTYIKIRETASAKHVDSKLTPFIHRYMADDLKQFGINVSDWKSTLQPLKSIHLYSSLKHEHNINFNITYLYIYAAIAIFLLVVVCINFINLSIARSIKRTREIGIRKVVGAHQTSIFAQFIGETFLVVLIAFAISICLAQVLLPYVSSFLGQDISFGFISKVHMILFSTGIILTTAFLAGGYPAFILSAFQPFHVLKKTTNGPRKLLFSKVLLVGQFTISIALIISAIFTIKQLHFIKDKELGFDKEQILMVKLGPKKYYNTLKQELKSIPEIFDVSAMSHAPGFASFYGNYVPEGSLSSQSELILTTYVDFDIVPTLGFDIVQGRQFRKTINDKNQALIINETAAKHFGWENPVGKQVKCVTTFSEKERAPIDYTVIGVVKDFHFRPMHETITPVVLRMDSPDLHYVMIRFQSNNIKDVLDKVQTKWMSINKNEFEYSFLDERINQIYRSEMRLSKLFQIFTVLTIFTSCMGLLGLVAFSVEQRIKEIGIRKIIGASVPGIVYMLTKDFTKWILLANIFSWTIAWYFANKWLQNFAYRIDLTIWPFLLAGVAALVIALFTISWQAIRAATANPVEALRYE